MLTPSAARMVKEEADGLPPRLELPLVVNDREVIAALCSRPEGPERAEFALTALRIGVLALRQAQGQVDANVLRQEGDRLLNDVERHLETHRKMLDQKLEQTLKEYFDPTNGRFNERVQRLLAKDGELERVLQKQLLDDDSEFCRTLMQHVGKESALFKLLSPEESTGVIRVFQQRLQEELKSQRDVVLRDFSLDNPQGALSRVVEQLTKANGELQEGFETQVERIRQEFSFDDDNSALSRMKRTIDLTSEAISKHLTLDTETSALSRLKREFTEMFKQHSQQVQEFQTSVRQALAALEARKQEAAQSTRHGLAFEAAVFEFVQSDAQRAGDIAESVGNSTGVLKGCKKGDAVLTLGPESVAAGTRIVVEAKESSSYNLKDALAEIDEARRNRDAEVGVFVFSKSSAPEGLEPIRRYGQDLVIVWDAEDTATDLPLTLGLSVARALCSKKAREREQQQIDFTEIDRSLAEIQKQLESQDEIQKQAESIQKCADKILERLRISRDKASKAADKLRDSIEDIKLEVNETNFAS